ncbi:MAG: hypothetical protein DLM61_22355 [Pseudonocardiales bacterium]|nr:MAG: hypothetical protein DLM61_22355 [Pseudonocardiales bacterium]
MTCRRFTRSKSIVVLGAGQAVVKRYAREGYAVVLVARRPESLDLIAKELNHDGGEAHAITRDRPAWRK